MKVSAQQTFSPFRLVLIETFFTHNVKSDDNVACETLRDFLRRDSNGKTMRTRPRQFGINALWSDLLYSSSSALQQPANRHCSVELVVHCGVGISSGHRPIRRMNKKYTQSPIMPPPPPHIIIVLLLLLIIVIVILTVIIIRSASIKVSATLELFRLCKSIETVALKTTLHKISIL